mmetsp:Transcript_122945/g.353159  ORF Transcript_122945/g.353159 Transcript_122945/m.353159 type:complete len:234 (+) Transcript_122945:1227-1928(+)
MVSEAAERVGARVAGTGAHPSGAARGGGKRQPRWLRRRRRRRRRLAASVARHGPTMGSPGAAAVAPVDAAIFRRRPVATRGRGAAGAGAPSDQVVPAPCGGVVAREGPKRRRSVLKAHDGRRRGVYGQRGLAAFPAVHAVCEVGWVARGVDPRRSVLGCARAATVAHGRARGGRRRRVLGEVGLRHEFVERACTAAEATGGHRATCPGRHGGARRRAFAEKLRGGFAAHEREG